MKITIIYDNESRRRELQADWGFAALVESRGRRILFDTGANGSILLSNMRILGIAPEGIDDVFISHAHLDHTGGLSAFLEKHQDATVWVPPSFSEWETAKHLVEVKEPRTLCEGFHSTGELEEIEQSLCVETAKGIVVVAGCSHPRMETILREAGRFGELYGIVGGLHGNPAESLRDLKLICATHCTYYKREIKASYGARAIEGGVGTVIELGQG